MAEIATQEQTTAMEEVTPSVRIQKARTVLVKVRPFTSHVIMTIPYYEDSELPYPAAVAHDWSLSYNPKIVEKLDTRELAGTLYHEVWHLLLEAFSREGERDAVAYIKTPTGWRPVRLWNLAHDLAINSAIRLELGKERERYGLHDHPLKLPDGVVYPEHFDLPDGKTAEWYYDQLVRKIQHCKCECHGGGKSKNRSDKSPADQQGNADADADNDQQGMSGQGDGGEGQPDQEESGEGSGQEGVRSVAGKGEGCCPCHDGGCGPHGEPRGGMPRIDTKQPVNPCPELPPKSGHGRVNREIRKYVRMKAAEYLRARGIGDSPGEIELFEQFVERILGPRVNWRRVLRSELRQALQLRYGHDRYSFAKASRRQDVLPDLPPPAKLRQRPIVAVVADTSGSMIGDVQEVLAEVKGIIQAAGEEVHYLSVDTDIHFADRIRSVREAKLRGFGGTDMRVGIAEAMKLRPRPTVVVVITDGDSPWDMPPPRARVIVCLIDGDRNLPKWARKIVVERPRR